MSMRECICVCTTCLCVARFVGAHACECSRVQYSRVLVCVRVCDAHCTCVYASVRACVCVFSEKSRMNGNSGLAVYGIQ